MAAHSPPSSEHGGQCRAAGGALQWLTTRLRSSPFALNIELLVGGLEHYIYIFIFPIILGTIISSGTFAAVGQVHLMGDFDEALLQNCSNLLDWQAEVQRFTSSLAWRWSKNISLFT
jgi:hypothetical protein